MDSKTLFFVESVHFYRLMDGKWYRYDSKRWEWNAWQEPKERGHAFDDFFEAKKEWIYNLMLGNDMQRFLDAIDACGIAREFVRSCESLEDAWKKNERLGWIDYFMADMPDRVYKKYLKARERAFHSDYGIMINNLKKYFPNPIKNPMPYESKTV